MASRLPSGESRGVLAWGKLTRVSVFPVLSSHVIGADGVPADLPL